MSADDRFSPENIRRNNNQLYNRLTQRERNRIGYHWTMRARPEQLAPDGDWRIWLIMAGRGFGKTRAGAEWVRRIADDNPGARIALVGASLAEARSIMVEGESGLLSIYHPSDRPRFEPSLHRVSFRNGATAQLFSAAEPESLRGPQHSHAHRASAKGVFRQSGARHPRCIALPRGGVIAARSADDGR